MIITTWKLLGILTATLVIMAMRRMIILVSEVPQVPPMWGAPGPDPPYSEEIGEFLTRFQARLIIKRQGALAQLGERCVRNAEVRGSSPLCSTIPLGWVA